MKKVVCIVQARYGSTRLPGKVLKEIAGKPMLEHQIDRLKKAETVNEIVIATTTDSNCLPIIEIAKKCGVSWFAGSEDDVLSRYTGAARQSNADVVIRVTSDCPLIDPVTLDKTVKEFLAGEFDYLASTNKGGFPRGLDSEVFSREALEKVDALVPPGQSPYREHVTLYMYRHPEEFKVSYIKAGPPLNRQELRLCVDTPEDFRLIEEIYQALYQPGRIIDILDVIDLFNKRPELAQINAHVEQKKV